MSRYGAGWAIVPTSRTAQPVSEDGYLVISGTTQIDDDVVFGLIDSGRPSAPTTRQLPTVLAELDGAGGAVYDPLVALAAREHDALATRDGRARATYEAVGVRGEVAAAG